MNLTEINEKFRVIERLKNEINNLEESIKPHFANSVVEFFKDKGFSFNKSMDCSTFGFGNSNSVYSYYNYDNQNQPLFKKSHVSLDGVNQHMCPYFRIKPFEFSVKFQWWKKDNLGPTTKIWYPDKMSLEDFYEKHLKNTFILIKNRKNI